MKKFHHLPAFCKDRRGAIAVIFAIALLSLAMMVGLSIDTAFYAQAKSQIGLAADAAATHAVRAATSTYQMETAESPPVSQTQAQADGVAAGETAGLLWFHAQLGNLPTATLAGITDPNIVVSPITSVAAGFTANVTYTGQYPTFFGGLFRNKKAWAIAGTSTAQTAFSYIEVLMMLDTSGSMFIGALPADIETIEDNTVCVPDSSTYNDLANVDGIPGISASGNYNPVQYDAGNTTAEQTSDEVDFTAVLYFYQTGSRYQFQGTCANQNYTLNTLTGTKGNFGPLAPCAFACHTTTTTSPADGYTEDFYGIARRAQKTAGEQYILKEDYVLAATEDVINQMVQNQQGQFSVGVYQFNDNVSGIATGTTGVDSLAEASSDLKTVLKKVTAVDYNLTPTETAIPALINASASDATVPANGYTDFADSMNNLRTGTNDNLGALAPASTTAGLKPSTPQRDLFIVTDGLEDSLNGNGTRYQGEMTSVTTENNGTITGPDAAVCYPYKQLGFTVYVLYVPYNRVPNTTYYVAADDGISDPWTNEDYPAIENSGGQSNGSTIQNYVEGTSGMTTSPDMAALEACASSPSDFFEATDSSQIDSKMTAMLQSALTTSIRLTQ